MIKALVGLFMAPLFVLNWFGGISSGIWLVVLGEWGAIGTGLVALAFSTFALAFVMIPSFLFAIPAAFFIEKNLSLLAVPFSFLNSLYIVGLVTAWCCFVFYFYISDVTPLNDIPKLIWSYGVAVGPWGYMAQKEAQGGSSEASSITVFFAQIGYLAVGLVYIFGSATIYGLATIFFSVMGISVIVCFVVLFSELRSEIRNRY